MQFEPVATKSFNFKPGQDVALFDYLRQTLKWQSPNLEHGFVDQPFECAGENITRLEAFMGYTIGPDDADLIGIGKRNRMLNGRIIRVNSKVGVSKDRGWDSLTHTDCPGGSDLLESVKSFLFDDLLSNKHLTKDAIGFQCNVNLYAAGDEAQPHRDDCTHKGQPLENTFEPAAVTCLLYHGTMSEEAKRSASFVLCTHRNASKVVLGVDLEKISSPEFKREYNLWYAPADVSLIGLAKTNYSHGKHWAQTNWQPEGVDRFTRMSLNFRVVKAATVAALEMQDYKQAKPCNTSPSLVSPS